MLFPSHISLILLTFLTIRKSLASEYISNSFSCTVERQNELIILKGLISNLSFSCHDVDTEVHQATTGNVKHQRDDTYACSGDLENNGNVTCNNIQSEDTEGNGPRKYSITSLVLSGIIICFIAPTALLAAGACWKRFRGGMPDGNHVELRLRQPQSASSDEP